MKIGFNEFDKYTEQEQANKIKYFSLKNDGDNARCRILYESVNDIEAMFIHKVKLSNGYIVNVDCLREYGDPQDACPLCASPVLEDRKIQKRVFIPIFMEDKQEVCFWERGIKFVQDVLAPLMIEKGAPFCSNICIIERSGQANDIQTSYDIYTESQDDSILEDFGDIPATEGTAVLKKTFDELERFVKARTFDPVSSYQQTQRTSSAPHDEDIRRRRGTLRPNTQV